MKPIPYGRQNITQEDINSVVEVLESDFLTQGPKISEFESSFAQYIGAQYAIAVNNGTAALHLSALALGVGKGKKIITTPNTFAATPNSILYCGGEVEFADIDSRTGLIDLDYVENLLKSSKSGTYSGIIPVDYAGYPVDLERTKILAEKYGLWIIEDACHAPGAYFFDSQGEKHSCGNGDFADLSIFSFHPVKHIATGEGGMITTNNEELYKKILKLRTHGITKDPEFLIENHGGWYYEMQELGYNYRITDFQAALGISQLQRADWGLKRRNEIAQKYNKAFSNTSVIIPELINDVYHAYHLYVIHVADRSGLYNYLKSENIISQVHYIPIHTFPYYQRLGWKKGDFPNAENFYNNCLSLPMFPSLTESEQKFVIEKVNNFCNA
jgi:UDP-4-amino-4,6-dideoxy-N-acetyl-beta-L-altrosamine transaminase